jgi:hypothetical protein
MITTGRDTRISPHGRDEFGSPTRNHATARSTRQLCGRSIICSWGRKEIAGIARNMLVDMPRSLMRDFFPDFFFTVEEGVRITRDMPLYLIRSFFLLERTGL